MADYTYQSRITEYRGAVRRIVDHSTTEFKLVEFGWVNQSECHSPVKVGDVVLFAGVKSTVASLPDDDDGLSVSADSSFRAVDAAGTNRSICYSDGTCLNFQKCIKSENESTGLTENPIYKETTDFLREVNYNFTPEVVSKIVDDAYEAKSALREKFRTSKFWNEELQALIVPDFSFKTKPDYYAVREYVEGIFESTNDSYWNRHMYNTARDALSFVYKNQVYLNDDTAERAERFFPSFRFHPGMKVSKFFRAIFEAAGINNDNCRNFESRYAALSDACSPKEHKRILVLSLNIMDFLTMSDGNSWDSCHSIRHRGCYHGGTLSYALDNVTAILYTLPADTDISAGRLWEHGKINRQLFMFGDNLVIESRLYPDCNKMDIRSAHHDLVSKLWSEFTHKEWYFVPGDNSVVTRFICNHERTTGNHYPDYHYNQYNITALRTADFENDEKINIGAISPDIVTGAINSNHEVLTSTASSESYDLRYEDVEGYTINNIDNVVFYNGEVYNSEDCTWCNREAIYVPEDDAVYIDGDYYSSEYAEENFVRCDHCGDYIEAEDVIECDGDYYCESCADSVLSYCEHCGTYHHETIEVDDTNLCDDCLETQTKVCHRCGERHLISYFRDDICLNCMGEVQQVVLPESGVILIKNYKDFRKFAKAAKKAGYTWKSDGVPMDNTAMYGVINRTYTCPTITGLGFIIADNKVSYTPKTAEMEIPERFGDIIKFEDLSRVTVESEA